LPIVRFFDLPSGQPPTRVGDLPSGPPSSRPSTRVSGQPSSPALAPTCDLRRLPILPACLPTRLQLAPSIRLPVPPSKLTSDSHRPLDPFGAAFQPTCSLRRLPTFQPCLTNPDVRLRLLHLRLCFPACLRLASSTCLSAWPLNSTSDSAVARSLRRCRLANLRLAPPVNLPALPGGPNLRFPGVASLAPLAGQSLTRVSDQPWATFGPISNLRWLPTLRLNLPVDLQLALSINLPAAFGSNVRLSP